MGALRPGQMLDGTNYQVVRELGAGGMGVVYEIEHVRLKKRYVAKVIHEQIKNDDGAAKRMEREAQVLAGISHPNIVQVHDIGTTQEGVSYFVMEKLEGVDLRSMMKHGVTRIRSIEIATDVLDALEYVHRRKIVHRDIKPENVFLSEQPNGTITKVLDFGIVHIFDKDGRVSQGRITKTGGFVGTLYYAAPEQMQGKPASPPNDVYAAGLVLFELLAGKGPFDDDPGVGLSRCFKPAPLLTDFVPQAPRELSDALAKALEQDPERRPRAGALATELRAIAAALKSTPGVAEDEAIRAEIHDLLRHMAPVDDPPPRPAAGRMATPDREHGAAFGLPGSPAWPPPAASIATDATAAPATPVMPGAPAREPSGPRDAYAATLASATGDPRASDVHGTPGPAVGHAHAHAPVSAAPLSPTMLGAGVTPQRQSHPDGPHMAPQRTSSSGVPAGPNPLVAHSVSAPPPSPRFPPGTERGIGPAQASPAYVHTPSPDHIHPSQPRQQPLFATSTPARVMRAESTPGAPARHGDTSPGLYATVDNQPSSAPLPKRPPWAAITLAAGAVVLVALVLGGALAFRHKAADSTSTGSSAESSAGTAATEAMPETSSTNAPAGSAPERASAPQPAAVDRPGEASVDAPGEAIARSEATSTSAPAVAKPVGAAPHPAAASQPAARAATTNAPAMKAAAPAATPRASSSAPHAAEKDGYVRSF